MFKSIFQTNYFKLKIAVFNLHRTCWERYTRLAIYT